MESVTSRVHEFFDEKVKEADKNFILMRVCGYSSARPLAEVWQIAFFEDETPTELFCVQREDSFGCRWNGENEALDRLILSIGTVPEDGAEALGLTTEQTAETLRKVYPHTYESLILNAAPIQDAIDLARFMVETTKGFIRFSITSQKTVGGPIEIAAITKHEGFKWVQRKDFFSSEFNKPL